VHFLGELYTVGEFPKRNLDNTLALADAAVESADKLSINFEGRGVKVNITARPNI